MLGLVLRYTTTRHTRALLFRSVVLSSQPYPTEIHKMQPSDVKSFSAHAYWGDGTLANYHNASRVQLTTDIALERKRTVQSPGSDSGEGGRRLSRMAACSKDKALLHVRCAACARRIISHEPFMSTWPLAYTSRSQLNGGE